MGLPIINIPITTVKSSQLNLPISLSYHGGGIKIAELASWVGLNWSLNAGGVINREVKGGPDESYSGDYKGNYPAVGPPGNGSILSGWYDHGGYPNFLTLVPCGVEGYPACDNTGTEKINHFLSAGLGIKDTEPDIFSFNIGGKSGKFYFDQDRVAQFIPNQDIKIEVNFDNTNKQFIDFILITDDGTRYYFGGTNFEKSTSAGGYDAFGSTGAILKSSWLLYKIESADRQDVINLEYVAEGVGYNNLRSQSAQTSGTSKFTYVNLSNPNPFVSISNYAQRLSKISSSQMEVNFLANTTREDVASSNAIANNLSSPKRLDVISIKSIDTPTNEISFAFDYGYYQAPTPANGNFEADLNAITTSTDKKRLKLLSIQEKSGDGTLTKPKTEFLYESTELPRRLSFQRDHLGYFNGQANNKLLIDHSNANPRPDRTADFNYMKSGHLQEIKWPTGGSTKYIFESNKTCSSCPTLPGLRIQEIQNTISNVVVNKKVFNYLNGGSPISLNTYGVFLGSINNTDWQDFALNNTWPSNIGYPSIFINNTNLFASNCYPVDPNPMGLPGNFPSYGQTFISSDIFSELKSILGQTISYGTVFETSDDGSKEEYRYKTVSPYQTISEFPYVGNTERMYFYLNQGKLTYQASYKSSSTIIKETRYDYNEPEQNILQQPKQLAYKFLLALCSGSEMHVKKYYLPKTVRSLLIKKTETVYDENGNNPVEVVTNHLYGTNHEQPITTSMNRSNGDSLVTETKFVKDYTEVDNYNSGDGYSIYAMQARNINAPIETLTFVKKAGETNANMKAIAGRITLFDDFSGNANNLKPREIYSLKVVETPVTVTRSTANNNQFTIDGKYEKRAEFTYNAAGLLQTERLVDGAYTTYYYSGNGLLTSKVEASGTGIAQTTSYVHNDLFGLKQITEPNGLIKTFDYDKLGRLALIKDNNGDILAKNTYEYGTFNRVGTYLARGKTTDPANLNTSDYAAINFQYFDGLGREIQKIGFKASPLGNDIASDALTYDLNGRPKFNYLPYPTTLSTGAYQSDNQGKAKSFYNNDDYPYSETNYEASSLNRPNEQVGPGVTWRSPNKSVILNYATAGSTIPLYKISGTSISYNLDGKYPSNSLFKTTKTDEENHSTVEIKDIEGKVIQKQVQGPSGYMTTHYVYNDLNQLKAVIQPEAYPLTTDLAEGNDTYKGNVFFYKYDNRKRIISKKVPAAGEEYMAYDRWDRLVLSQSALQRIDNNRWSFYKYDALNREIYRGDKEYGGTSDPNTLQASAMASTTVGENRTSSIPFYNGAAFPDNGSTYIAQINLFDTYDDWRGAELNFVSGQTPHSAIANTTGLLTGAYVRNLIDNNWLKLANYYDNKSRLIQSTKTTHLSGANAEVMSTEYNFAGEPMAQKMIHKKTGKPDLSEKTMFAYDHVGRTTQVMHFINDKAQNIAVYEHDEIGRQKTKKINAIATAETKKAGVWSDPTVWKGSSLPIWNNTVKINHNITVPIDYLGFGGTLEMGSPSNLNMLTGSIINLNGENNNWPYLQKIDYDYHIRGGLLGINLDGNKNTSLSADNDLFSYKLGYGLDGNISRQEWQHSGTGETRSYDFGYDQASRLTSANYSPSGTYSTSNTYDKNGNILTMNRAGVDQLTYNYQAGRLIYVNDGISGNADVGDFRNINTGTNDYEYAEDGSLKVDRNEGITGTNYNTYLKQPRTLSLSGSRSIDYKYDGSGKLLRTIYSTGETWDYVDNLVYKNGEYFSMNTAEGRANYVGSNWNYEYFYTDHLGNTRASFVVENEAVTKKSTSDFDPWGFKLSNGTINPVVNRFELQGYDKEMTFGLNRINMGNRSYNPTIGKMDRVDNFADKYASMSSYQYCANNPLRFTEVNGDSLMMTYFDSNNQAQTLYYNFTEQGGYGFYNKDGSAYERGGNDFVDKVEGALGRLGLGAEGRKTVDFISGNEQNVSISQGKNQFDDQSNTVGFNPYKNTSIPTEGGVDGMALAPTFISLGHELGHAEDKLFGGLNRSPTWNGFEEAEKYSTHKENLFRGENNLPLRTTYGAIVNPNTKSGLSPNFNSTVIDKRGNSLFYNPINYRKK